ncbi:MAG: FAD-dependent oxidoreductase [Haloarculaceae archaeon]
MGEQIDDVVIVGGGDAGLLTALGLRKMNPEISVSVVDNFDADIPRVGKATFREILPLLHGSLDIDERRFISEVKPVWKATAYFRDWCGYQPFHYPFDPATKFPNPHEANTYEQYYHWYTERYADPNHLTIGEEIADQGKAPWYYDPSQGAYEKYSEMAYHLDTERFNTFLRTLCREEDVALIDDVVTEVETTGNHVDRVRSESQSYEADLYVDGTGFNRLLKGRQDTPFTEFEIPLDAAVTTQVDRSLSDIVPATVLDTGEYGWFWQIDTYEQRDLGYVYASEYVSDEDARAEFVEHFDEEYGPDDVVKYDFDSGFYEQALADNCLAVGNAVGFVEPLQAPALTTHAKAAVQLGSLLSAHNRVLDGAVRDAFNAWMTDTWNSIYDFISIHYAFSSGDNEFWEAMQSIDLRPRTRLLIDEYDRAGIDRNVDPTTKETGHSSFEIFHPMAFYIVMRHMGATSSFYEEHPATVTDEFREFKDDLDQATTDHVDDFITHEEMYKGVVDAW